MSLTVEVVEMICFEEYHTKGVCSFQAEKMARSVLWILATNTSYTTREGMVSAIIRHYQQWERHLPQRDGGPAFTQSEHIAIISNIIRKIKQLRTTIESNLALIDNEKSN